MSKEDVLDIAHVGFLEMIKALIGQSGAPSTKGTLIRIALAAADKVDNVDYPSIEDFLTAVENVETNISRIEGPAVHIGDGVFGLPKCPFADSIVNYKDVFKGMPEGFAEVTNEFNREGIVTDKFRVGSGAGVSPFCAIHQPLRSALGNGITIGGKKTVIYQLGCKSAGGAKGLAQKWINESGHSEELVTKVLDDHMCCYCIKVEE